MLHAANKSEGSGFESGPLNMEIQTAVRAELEVMLRAPIFAQSSRCKRFLSHVVLQTLAGNAGQLKERTIGISVFDRANDYETGDDSIVRVTANDVRKRLGQFYRESPDAHPIQIELPRGSYVPEFRLQPLREGKKLEEAKPSESVDDRGPAEASSEVPSVSLVGSASNQGRAATTDLEVPVKMSARPRLIFPVILILIAGIVISGTWRSRARKNVPDLWGSFLNATSPVLICIDTHDLHLRAASSPDSQRFVDLVLYKQSIALDDAAVLSSMASVLGKKGIPFRVVGAEQTSLSDFRRQPVILIGAIDNKWTLRLTQGLRYRIEVANPPGSGSDKEPIASIVDSERGESTPWITDLSTPFSAWKNDYAIVARMDDSTTGVPVLIEAGLGNDGSLAASEFITSGALEARLANEPTCHGKSNFEAVVGTEIIDTRPGPPHALRLICW